MTSLIPPASSGPDCCCEPGSSPPGGLCYSLSSSCPTTLAMSTLTITTGWTCDYVAPVGGCYKGTRPQGNYSVVLPAITLTKPTTSTTPYYCGQGTASVSVRYNGQIESDYSSCNDPCYVPGTYVVCDEFDETFTFDVPYSVTINCYPITLGLPAVGCWTAPGAGMTQMLVLTITVAKYTHQHAWLYVPFIVDCRSCTGTFCDTEDVCVGVQQACFNFYCYVNSTTCAGSRTWLPLSWGASWNLNDDCDRGAVQPSYPWYPCDSICGGATTASWYCGPNSYSLGGQQGDPTNCDWFDNNAQYGCLNHTIYRVLTNPAYYPLEPCEYDYILDCDSTWSGVGVTGWTIFILSWSGSHSAISIT